MHCLTRSAADINLNVDALITRAKPGTLLIAIGSSATTSLIFLLAPTIVRRTGAASADVILHVHGARYALVSQLRVLLDKSLVDFHAELAAFERQLDHVGFDGLD